MMMLIVLILLFLKYVQSHEPVTPHHQMRQSLSQIKTGLSAAAIVTGASLRSSFAFEEASTVSTVSTAASVLKDLPLGEQAYSMLGTQPVCKIMNGMWQVSGAHGYVPNEVDTVKSMEQCAKAGFTTFDAADIYGAAEDYIGSFKRSSQFAKDCPFFTKWVPRPGISVSKGLVTDAINKSLRKMNTDRLDLLQFHWWEYDNLQYYNALEHLMELQQDEKIRNLALTNIDSVHMLDMIKQGANIVSNQVSFSVLDTRPLYRMIPTCAKNNVQILAYGTLLGGFLSDKWLGKPDPEGPNATAEEKARLKNVSLRKYLPWIRYWGGWDLFQELLTTLRSIADKHDSSISNVAVQWVINQPFVAGAIIGVRFGLSEHIQDNLRIIGSDQSIRLTNQDLARIAAVQTKAYKGSLLETLGDCGWEYRGGGRAYQEDPDRQRLRTSFEDVSKYLSQYEANVLENTA